MLNLALLKNRLGQLAESPDKGSRIAAKFLRLYHLLSPISEITTTAALEDLLSARSSRFRQLRAELEAMSWTTLVELERSGDLYADAREAARAKTDLLGAEQIERFLRVVDSAEAFNRWMFEISEQGPQACYRLAGLNQQVGEPALYADMCIDALSGVFTDFFSYWTLESIATLVAAADDYMTRVEDVFLAEGPVADDDGERVDFETLRQGLGL